MERMDTVVIGAGHAGLAVSHELARAGVEHVVLERSRTVSRWRDERWDSFCLLTPNWATWLPGWHYTGPEPHGFMTKPQIVDYFDGYARSFHAPVRENTSVHRLHDAGGGSYLLSTDHGDLTARTVVIATGPFQRARVPAWSQQLAGDITQVHSSEYRRAADLPTGGALVVGAGPSGQQIAEDLLRAGRDVSIAVGSHRRVPRRYRGRDYYWWLELGGFYEKTAEDASPVMRAHPVAPVLTGYAGGHDLDLRELAAHGVTLLGRAQGGQGTMIHLADDLHERLEQGDRAYHEFVAWVEERLYRFDGLFETATPAEVFPDPPSSPTTLDLAAAGISTIVWATGFENTLRPWVELPIVNEAGIPVHRRGVTSSPGVYLVGRAWLHRLRSAFIRGAQEDAGHIAALIAARLASAE